MFSLIIPFHSDFDRLPATVKRFQSEGHKWNVTELLLCHNGRPLDESQIKAVQAQCSSNVRYVTTPGKGIGAGYAVGIQSATQAYCILSASDLPFGFTDVDGFLKRSHDGKNFDSFAIGSKAHSGSVTVAYGPLRKLASFVFLSLRKALLGSETPGDSQGSLIIKTEIARQLVPDVRSLDYFFSLELITLAQRRGIRVVEVPIVLENHDGRSSVSLTKDGWSMFKRIWELSKRK